MKNISLQKQEMVSKFKEQRLLFIDDDLKILKGIERLFIQRKVPWKYVFATGIKEAYNLLESTPIDAVISDINMPGGNGFQLLSKMRGSEKWADVPIVMLTGLGEPGLKTRALELGATDLLNKPVNADELMARIQSILQLKQYQDTIRMQNLHLEKLVQKRTAALKATQLDMVWRLARAAEFRNIETGNHVIRVGYFSYFLADELGFGSELLELIFSTSPLHDIGKIGIPDNILLKEGKLTPAEWIVMKTHSNIGEDLLSKNILGQNYPQLEVIKQLCADSSEDNPFLQMAAEIAGYHHEKWDGNGYPYGISGEEIPLSARIVAVSDVYDALRSTRPYKQSFTHKEAVEIMKREKGKYFDPEIFEAFENCQSSFIDIFHKYEDEDESEDSSTIIEDTYI